MITAKAKLRKHEKKKKDQCLAQTAKQEYYYDTSKNYAKKMNKERGANNSTSTCINVANDELKRLNLEARHAKNLTRKINEKRKTSH